MTDGDFDIDGLAVYLHLTPSQVTKMADRGQVPGRRINGKWRFHQAEIHHWLEDRIGASEDEAELRQVEAVLERAQAAGTEDVLRLEELLPVEAVACPLQARSRRSVIAAMVELAAHTGLVWDPEKMEEAVRAREELHPTALDNGVALLHPRRPMTNILGGPVLAVGRSFQGIPFSGSSGLLTDLFFLICSYDDPGHLQLLARLSRLIADPETLPAMREADSPAALRQAVLDAESRLSERSP